MQKVVGSNPISRFFAIVLHVVGGVDDCRGLIGVARAGGRFAGMRAILRHVRAPLVAIALLAVVPAAASAATYYANPSGTGSICTQAAPCSLLEAIEVAGPGASVVLQPGTYAPPSAVFIASSIDVGGETGKAASTVVNLVGGPPGIDVFVNSAGAVAHDFTIVGTGETAGLQLLQGTVERIVSSYSGAGGTACEMDPQAGTVLILRDSLCWMDAGETGAPAGAVVLCCGFVGSLALRNDTFVSTGPEGVGIIAAGRETGTQLAIEAVNVIARGTGTDVKAIAESGGQSGINFSHSNYVTVATAGGAVVSPSSTAGNQTAQPLFADAAAGDFRELPGSPTIDAGLSDPLNGALDLAGQPRSRSVCGSATDIGAYEATTPVTACASGTPLANPSGPPSNLFQLKRVKKQPGKGIALLSVSVPGAGQFTLWGKGVKRVALVSRGAEVLKLGVVSKGDAKRRLESKGKVQVGLKLRFVPTGGAPLQETRRLTLLRSRGSN
jgi:hypothetical protein